MASVSIDGLILTIHPTDFAKVTKELTTTAVKTTFTDPSRTHKCILPFGSFRN